MITIFCTPKNFEGIFDIIQKNALRSWRYLSDDIEIIIFGNSIGAQEISDEVKGIHFPDVKCSKNGVPYLSDMFFKANKIASYNVLLFINSDIVLPKNSIEIFKKANQTISNFLFIGHRWDLNVNNFINFKDPSIISKFWRLSKSKSKKNSPAAIDYFLFRKNSLKKIPNFVIGRPGYDNWLIWYARRKFIPVIDISSELEVIHQTHHFNFHNLKKDPKIVDKDGIPVEEDGFHNFKIHGKRVLNILDANYTMENGNITKKKSKEYIYRNLGKLPIIFPEFSIFLNVYKKLYRMVLYKALKSN